MQEILAHKRNKKISIVNFGDEEIDLTMGHSIPYYNGELATTLKKTIAMTENQKLLVCLPDV